MAAMSMSAFLLATSAIGIAPPLAQTTPRARPAGFPRRIGCKGFNGMGLTA